jgi:hypothetical protein
MTKRDMDNFDWVSALSSCSLVVVFEKLRQQVSDDVDRRIAKLPKGSHYGFQLISESPKNFTVSAVGNKIHCTVAFILEEDGINVHGFGYDEAPQFHAKLTLNNDGECRAKIDGQEREFWQMRKMALETLFFRAY